MRPAGREQVDAAKADGRWDKDYAGSADMTVNPDFRIALGESRGSCGFGRGWERGEVCFFVEG